MFNYSYSYKNRFLSIIFFCFASTAGISLVSCTQAPTSIGHSLKTIPVQSGGRVQPFDSFAKNTLRFIYGKSHFNNIPAVDVLMLWILLPDHWDKESFIQIKSAALKKALKLDIQKPRFSPTHLLGNKILLRELSQLHTLVQNKEFLNQYWRSMQKLENRLLLYQTLQRGDAPGWVPHSPHHTNSSAPPTHLSSLTKTNWLSLNQLSKSQNPAIIAIYKAFQHIVQTYIATIADWYKEQKTSQSPPQEKQTTNKLPKYQKHSQQLKNKSTKEYQQQLAHSIAFFQSSIKSQNPLYEKLFFKINLETRYNQINPFRWAWLLYLIGLLSLWGLYLLPNSEKKPKPLIHKANILPLLILLGAFCLHTYGIVARSLIMSRPPVTNMYETVIWVPWVSVILGTIFWIWQRFFSVFVCSAIVAVFCLLLTDSAPSMLDGQLEPLEAVLRSNFWLSTHVLIITMSYSAFFLAFVLGDVTLYFFLQKQELSLSSPQTETDAHRKKIKKYIYSINRAIQVGVVLLAMGTILGGVWADYSWGRFWGWDPKETWALISLLGYLALLHSHLVGWVKDFGMAMGAVLLFFLIIMAWYGVNYVLGQGLHSYGFGFGGIEYVLAFALIHLVYALIVWIRTQKL